MSEELKPCPFCGGKAALRMSWMADGHRYRSVECVECGATTPGNYSEVGDQSAWDWNTRTPEQAIAATLGGGECEAIHDESYYKGIHGYCEGLKCSNCGEPLFSEFKSCPWCGMTIRKAVKR